MTVKLSYFENPRDARGCLHHCYYLFRNKEERDFMNNRDYASEVIDIELDSDINKIVEKCQIRKNRNLLYIEIKKLEKKAVVIAMTKQNYSVFRNEIGKLLKDKKLQESDRKKVLDFIDEKYTAIYPDNKIVINEDEIDTRDDSKTNQENDLNDHAKIKNVRVSECLKLNSEKVKVSGNIVGRTEPYKVISANETSCDLK